MRWDENDDDDKNDDDDDKNDKYKDKRTKDKRTKDKDKKDKDKDTKKDKDKDKNKTFGQKLHKWLSEMAIKLDVSVGFSYYEKANTNLYNTFTIYSPTQGKRCR